MENVDYPLRSDNTFIGRFRARQFGLSQKILSSWIRPTVLGCDKEYLGVSDDDLVCYVIDYQSLADLLVVDKACADAGLPRPTEPLEDLEARSFFFLGHPEGRFGRQTRREQSLRMLRLFHHQQEAGERKIKIVPAALFWGHQPDKEKSIWKLLLSENWRVTSRFKKVLAAIMHRHHILVQFGTPVDLSEVMAEEHDPQKQVRKLLRLLRVHFVNQKQAIIGPDLSHRRTLIDEIMNSDAVRAAVDEETHENTSAVQKVEKRALKYANEIASDQSYRVIRFFHVLLSWLWNKLYDGIEVRNVDIAKEYAKTHEVVYIPCHRSHIDYLLLSYVLYHNGLTPPHIAAGKNLNLPIVGPLLRRGGAFFMRRSFGDDHLYRAIFDEYLHLMFTRGYSVEYFIEGGRSRTGRTLQPRTGMLSMTLRSYQRDSSKPIAFLPVYFGYERVFEAPTYMGELAGKAKKEESLFDIMSAVRTLSSAFGRVSVSFGEAVEFTPFLNEHLPEWKSPDVGDDSFSGTCHALGRLLATRINSAALVNPVNLFATAMLCMPKQTIEVHRLEQLSNLLAKLAGEQATRHEMNFREMMTHVEAVAGLETLPEEYGELIQAAPSTAVLLTYYRNNTLHVFALASMICRLVRLNPGISRTRIKKVLTKLEPFVVAELFMPEESLTGQIEPTLEQLSELGLIVIDDRKIKPAEKTTTGFANLADIGEIIEPTLERFLIVTSLLGSHFESYVDAMDEVQVAAATIARQMSALYGINAPEFFDTTLFRRFCDTVKATEQLDADSLTELGIEISQCLDPDVTFNINQAVSHYKALPEPT